MTAGSESFAARVGQDSGRSAPCVQPNTPDGHHRENVRSGRDVLPRSVQFSVAIDTATSSLLRATPSQCLASVLRFLWGRHLNGSLRIETTGSRSAIEKPGPGSRPLHAGHRLGSLQGTPQTSPDGITLHRFRCHVLVDDESPVVHLRSSF